MSVVNCRLYIAVGPAGSLCSYDSTASRLLMLEKLCDTNRLLLVGVAFIPLWVSMVGEENGGSRFGYREVGVHVWG